MNNDANIKITLSSAVEKTKQILEEKKRDVLYVIGINGTEGAIESISGHYTSANKAVDTGRLRASISFVTPDTSGSPSPSVPESEAGDTASSSARTPPNTVIVGSNVEYAEYVHNGTKRMGGRPFLIEGIEKTKDKMKRQVESVLKGGNA